MDLTFTCIKETCLYVKNLEITRKFYHDTLGLPLISYVKGRHVFFRAGTSVLLCFLAEATRNETRLPPHYGEGQLHFAFECRMEDYERWKQHILNSNIPIEYEAQWNERKSFYFRDPDGHLVEIVMPGIWG